MGVRRPGTAFLAAGICLAALLGLAGTASASVTMESGSNPCPALPQPAGMGDSTAVHLQFPYVPAPSPQRYYDGAVLRPTDTVAFPGKRPVVVLQHGWGEDMCSLWWAAQYLAGHGYVTSIHETPFFGDPDDFFIRVLDDLPVIFDADNSVVDYLKGPDNAFAAYTDAERLGFAGHGVGSIMASLIAGEHPELGIDAVVGLNNLRALVVGDSGAAFEDCFLEPQGRVLPAVPALGIAMDGPCSGNPTRTDPDIKLNGFNAWRSYGVASMELVMRGYSDANFVGDNAGTDSWDHMGHFMDLWFRRWLDADPSLDAQLLSPTLDGNPTVDALSAGYHSAAYLPPAVDTTDLAACLTGAARCDGKKDPDPPDPDPAELRVAMRLSSHRIVPGRSVRITVTVSNVGGTAVKPRFCLNGRLLKLSGSRCRGLASLDPGTGVTLKFKPWITRRVKAGRQFAVRALATSEAGDASASARLHVVREPRRRG